jgi:hypothetical protein
VRAPRRHRPERHSLHLRPPAQGCERAAAAHRDHHPDGPPKPTPALLDDHDQQILAVRSHDPRACPWDGCDFRAGDVRARNAHVLDCPHRAPEPVPRTRHGQPDDWDPIVPQLRAALAKFDDDDALDSSAAGRSSIGVESEGATARAASQPPKSRRGGLG